MSECNNVVGLVEERGDEKNLLHGVKKGEKSKKFTKGLLCVRKKERIDLNSNFLHSFKEAVT